MNAGAFTYVEPHLRRLANSLNLKPNVLYIGREAQVGANGSVECHKRETEEINKKIAEIINI